VSAAFRGSCLLPGRQSLSVPRSSPTASPHSRCLFSQSFFLCFFINGAKVQQNPETAKLFPAFSVFGTDYTKYTNSLLFTYNPSKRFGAYCFFIYFCRQKQNYK
jgi:hypothetical protein